MRFAGFVRLAQGAHVVQVFQVVQAVVQHQSFSISVFPHYLVDVNVQESKASFFQLYFWHIFSVHDFCSFYVSWLGFRDEENRGWQGALDEEDEEKETNLHLLGHCGIQMQ